MKFTVVFRGLAALRFIPPRKNRSYTLSRNLSGDALNKAVSALVY
ncbi:MAG: hypothetical protein ACR2ME_08060 [Acidimicrobiia bacterium]